MLFNINSRPEKFKPRLTDKCYVSFRYDVSLLVAIMIIAVGAGGSTVVTDQSTQQSDRGTLHHSGVETQLNALFQKGIQTQANTSTPTSPQNNISTEGSQSTILSVTGSISNPTPPGRTQITTTIELQSQNPIANGTAVVFNETYVPADIQIQSIETRAANTTGSVTGSVTQSLIDNESRPEVRLTTIGDIREVRLILKIEHPEGDTDTIYQVGIRPPGADGGARKEVADYGIRPIGDDDRSGRTEEFNRAEGSGFVYPNATVYQGEADIEFRGALEPPLRRIGGDTEGSLLKPPIADDTPTGLYSSDGTDRTAAVRVQTPKMNTLRVENSEDIDVSGGTVYPEATDVLEVTAQSNFEDAEEIELTVRNNNNLDITDEVIDTTRARPETPSGNPPVQTNPESSITILRAGVGQEINSQAKTTALATQKSNIKQSPQTEVNSSITYPTTAQTTGSVTPKRSLDQTTIDPGGTAEVTLTGVVGANGRITFAEKFTPTVVNTRINSISSPTGSVDPLLSLATEETVTVVADDLPPGEVVTLTYTIQVGPSDETYLIEGSVTATGQNVEYADTRLIVGSGGNTELTSNGKVTWELDLDAIETSSVSISVSGVDDLTGDKATANTNVAISHESVSLMSETKQPVRGQNVELSVQNGVHGSRYSIVILTDDLRSTVADVSNNVFRSAGTTQTTGVITQSGDQITGAIPEDIDPAAVFATVRVDPDTGIGTTEVRTQALTESSTIEILDKNTPADFVTTGRSAGSTDISVVNPSITLTGPDTYRTQSETTLTGTITPGVETAIMYVKTTSGFERVDLDSQTNQKTVGTSVSGESFSHDVTLSDGDGPGNEILSVPGTYKVTMRTKASLLSDHDGEIPATISKPEMVSEDTQLQTLSVRDTAVTLGRPGLNGSIATTESSVRLDGTAEGRETALIIGIGNRGSVETTQVDGPNFSDVTLPIDNFANGIVKIYAISVGRDGQIGDGEIGTTRNSTQSLSSLDLLQRHIQTTAETDADSKQLQEIIRNETDLDTGSDDAVITRELLVTNPEISIQTPTPGQSITDNTIQVRGRTNIRPVDSRIEVTLETRSNVIDNVYISQWETASWNTTISVPATASGRHIITASIDSKQTANQVMLANATRNTATAKSASVNTTSVSNADVDADAKQHTHDTATSVVKNRGTPTQESNDRVDLDTDTNTDADADTTTTAVALARQSSSVVSSLPLLRMSQLVWVVTPLTVGCIIFWLRLQRQSE